jgi:hypothetical protein
MFNYYSSGDGDDHDDRGSNMIRIIFAKTVVDNAEEINIHATQLYHVCLKESAIQ